MTYEKFEYKVISMLLEGDEPRLGKLFDQYLNAEIASREETEMGFTVNFLAPSLLAINESEGRIFGVEVKFSESETINLELVVKNGLIDRLKGIFTTEMSYSRVIRRYNDLVFTYKNQTSSEVKFQSDNHDLDEVTFVKNIGTLSQETVVTTSKDTELIEEPPTLIVDEQASQDDSEVKTKILVEENSQMIEEPTDDALIEEPFTLSTLNENVEGSHQGIPLDQAPDKMIPVSNELEIPAMPEATQASAMMTADNLMLPPSFSIPKVPEAIRQRWSGEVAALDQTLPQEKLEKAPQQEKKVDQSVLTLDELAKDSSLEVILDGKAPQGPTTLGEVLEIEADIEEIEEKPELEHLVEEEKEGVKEHPISNPKPEKEPESLQMLEIDSVEELLADDSDTIVPAGAVTVEDMENRTKELRIRAILIVLLTIILVILILLLISSNG